MLYDFGPRLLQLRKEQNLSQQELVDKAKARDPQLRLTDSVIGKYERDLTVPRLTEAAALADALDVSLDYLAYGVKCEILQLKQLNDMQAQLLFDLAKFFRIKNGKTSWDTKHNSLSKEEAEIIARAIDEIMKTDPPF